MGLYNNVPTFTYVSATGITVTYNKQVYTVQSFYTNKKYIYWDYDNATVLQASNTMPTRSFKTHLVIINDNGIATAVPSTYDGFEISYTGDSDDAIKSRIYALHQKDKELGDKYVAIEQDVDGIKQIVGSSEIDEGKGTIIDRLSSIEQTSKDISLKVEENQTAYNSDKEATKLREDLNSAIINLNANLSTFGGEIIGYYKDDKISNEEKVSVETMLELITYSRSEVLVYADKVKLVAQANENTSGVTSLNSAIQSLDTVHTSLINIVTTAIGDGIITPTEKTVITNAIAQYNLKINEFKNTCDDIIFLGFGGTVVEKLSQISMSSNEIRLSVSTVESNFTSDLSLQKEELKGQIEDVSNSLGTFKNTVETTFRDGLITEAEKKVLLEKIEQLEKEKLDVDARYLDAYNSKYLISPHKENLKNQHDKFDSKHSELKSKISEVIALGNVTENETLQINTLFNEYSVILSELKVVLDNSLDIISTGKANEEILKAKEELSKEIGDINNTLENVVDNLDYLVSDGIVDASERKAIESTLTSLEKEKTDVEAQFTYWGSNSYLVDPLKSQYDKVYETYLAKYDSLVNVIENIIYKEGLVNDTDRNNMTKADTALTNALYDFLDKTNEVIEFVTLKQYEDLISVVEEDIKDIYGNLKELDIVLDGTFEDNLIDQAERKVLNQNLTDLELQKTDVDTQYKKLYSSPYLEKTLKEEYKNVYDNFVEEYNNLLKTIQSVIDKPDLIDDSDRGDVASAHSNLNSVLSEFISMSNDVMDAIAQAQSDELKENFDEQMEDLNDVITDFSDDVYGAFKDGILTEAEKKVLREGLNELAVQKNDVDVQYKDVYNNINLTNTTVKSNLKTAYDDFVSKYNTLVSRINTLLQKATIVDTDKNGYNTAYENYKVSAKTFTEKFYLASESISDKVISDVKIAFNKEVSDLNKAIGDLDDTMNGIFKDGILSDAEKISIREQLAILEREKADVDANHSTVYSNANLKSTPKTNLKTAYDNYITSYNSLVNLVNSILNKTGIISSSDQSSYKNALSTYKGRLSAYTQALSKAIDNITTNSIASAKSALQSEIGDVLDALGQLETDMNDVFKDGVLSDAEKTTIKQQLETLKKEKGDVDKQYSALYNNKDLVDTTSAKPKSELKTAYDNFVTKYNSLVSTINTIIAKTTIVNDTDRTNLSNALNNYRTASSTYITKATNAIDSIASKKAETESSKVDKKFSDIIIGEDGILSKVETIQELSMTNFNNLVINSNIKNGIEGWRLTNLKLNKSLYQGTTTYALPPDRHTILIGDNSDNTAQTRTMDSTKFVVQAGEKISVSYYIMSNTYVNYGRVYILFTDNTKPIEEDNTFFDGYTYTGVSGYGAWVKKTQTVTVPTGATRAFVRIRYASSEKPTTSDTNRIALASLMVSRGENYPTWTGNSEDSYYYHESRISSAEQKITDDAITNTVSKKFYTKNDIDGKGYQTSSQVQQTVDSFKFSFSESGGYNKLYNSAFKNGTSEWSLLNWNNCGGTGGVASMFVYDAGSEWAITNRNALCSCVTNITNTSATTTSMGVGFDSNRIWGGVDWTFQCLLASHRAKSIQIEIIEFDSNGNRLFPNTTFVVSNPPSGGNDRNNWHKFHCTFTLIHSNCAWFIVRVFMNEWEGWSNSAYIWIAEPIVVLGHKSDIIYTPNSDELYSGNTTIDRNGITVKNGGLTIKNNAGVTVLKGDSNGDLQIKGNLTAGSSISSASITGGTITGGAISGGSITGTTLQNSAGTFNVSSAGNMKVGTSSDYSYISTDGGIYSYDNSVKTSGLYRGLFRFYSTSGSQVGNFGRSVWVNTSSHLSAINATYGHTVAIGAQHASSDTAYSSSLIASSIDQLVGSIYLKQGLNLIAPRITSAYYIPSGQNWTGDYNPVIAGSTSSYGNSLNLYGVGRIWMGVRASSYSGVGMEIRANTSATNKTEVHVWGHMNMNGYGILNSYITYSLEPSSSTTRSLADSGSLDMKVYSPYTFTENEIRYVNREAVHTTEEYDYNDNGEYVPTGRYLCYCEIPIFMAENMELNYHVNISKLSFGDYRILEKDPYYFIVESEKDSFSFTYEVVGKKVEKARNNAVVANYGIEKEEDKIEDKCLEYEL